MATTPKMMVVGSGAREHAICRAWSLSPQKPQISCVGSGVNPAIKDICVTTGGQYEVGNITDTTRIVQFAKAAGAEVVMVGPEAPLEVGAADALQEAGIGCVGPLKALAMLETSKNFTREIQSEYKLQGAVAFQFFESVEGVSAFIDQLQGEYVVKADGLMGGKGVKVSGDHLATKDEGLAYCQELLDKGSTFVIEEKCVGEEFSIMSFCDGDHLAHCPPVQDHKRAFDGDLGPNTGGMGSYADADGCLPWLSPVDVAAARAINEEMCATLKKKLGKGYKGVIYGQFMATRKGIQVIEFNARFGDPEVMNLLSVLESDFVALCQAVCSGTLTQEHAVFKPLATVTKYAVPQGYPDAAVKGQPIDISAVQKPERLYLAAVDQGEDGVLRETGSRTVAFVGHGATLAEAEAEAEAEISRVGGPLFHRKDIGTVGSLASRHQQMRKVRGIKIGVLGSTRGSSLQPIYDAITAGSLAASVRVVISNKSAAPILERARTEGSAAAFISAKGKTREEYDREATALLETHRVDCVLLIGYMRIVSAEFCEHWEGRCFNVHPTLLPLHAGLMNLEAHQAVLDAGDAETGCTVHFVAAEVDAGAVVVQKRCPVAAGDDAEALKTKVQALEGPALIALVQKLVQDALPAKGGATYAAAGVDIEAGNRLVEMIKPACKATARPGSMGGIGGFGGLFDLKAAGFKDPILVSGTDGVGTKLKVAQAVGQHSTIGQDLVAMVVNDLVVQGAEPLFFLDYFATGKLEVEEARDVVIGIANACKACNCALVGGETAEMPSMYAPGEYDLGGFAVGAVERGEVMPRLEEIAEGDVLLGIMSSGVHSNGYSLVRHLVDSELGGDWKSPCPWDAGAGTIGEAFLTPTKLYVGSCLKAVRTQHVRALAHITGGGLTENLPRVLPEAIAAFVNLEVYDLPPVFQWLRKAGNVENKEMLRTFNCGIGMVLVCDPAHVDEVAATLAAAGEPSVRLGTLAARNDGEAVVVQSWWAA